MPDQHPLTFYTANTPNGQKVAIYLHEAALPHQQITLDLGRGDQHQPAYLAINPNGKIPAIVDPEGPGGGEARVFDSSAILLYLAEKAGRFMGTPADRPALLSWLFFLGPGLGPFSGQAVHFQFAAPEDNDYARNRYRREAERHYRVLDTHLAGRDYIVGDAYSIADMSGWGWLDRASRVLKGEADPLAAYPNIKR
ncbi:glutathione S-transferase N-terminal domain-containing protein, partial [Pseudomonas stutzeri]|nr:glutathione S-transferase N-terminal domain-containing protein [Stutzerimonas stutzeri]